MITLFVDYQWSKGKPKGVSPIDDPKGKTHFRLLDVNGGVRV